MKKSLLKRTLIILLMTFTFMNLQIKAQVSGADTIRDNYGNKYRPEEISLDRVIGSGGNVTTAYPTKCTAGYFELYYEVGSGMEGTSALHQARRNIVCQVFTDISNWINSPLTGNTNTLTNKVKIAVRDPTAFPFPTGALAVGGHIFYGPLFTPGGGYIADNEVWKTINTGMDSFSALAFPSASGSNLYHGMISVDFTAAGLTSCPFNYSLGLSPSPTQFDFYSILLHEVGHVLGITSYINYNGTSKLTPSGQYYSRYDTWLRTPSNQPLILQSTGCGPMFLNFNSSLPVPVTLSPGSPGCGSLPVSLIQNTTNCATSIKFAGTTYTVPVYTPNCYNISSLSHPDDNCMPGSPNNTYFAVSKASNCGTSSFKRYFKKEEAGIICDLGYNITTTFGNSVNLNAASYTINCGSSVAGLNDGVTSGALYTIVTTPSVATGAIFPLSNDVGATSYTCLQVVNGSGSLSNTSGSGSFVYTPLNPGLHILEYLPINSAGKKGNITFVYIFVKDNCPMNCSISSNGGFESTIGCGQSQIQATQSFNINCWFVNKNTPDLYKRGCVSGGAALPVGSSTGPVDTPTGPGTGNDYLVFLAPGEGIQNQLSAPLTNGSVYQISFKYLIWGPTFNVNINLMVLGANLPSGPNSPITSTNIPSYYQNLGNVTSAPVNNSWFTYVSTFTYNASFSTNYVNFFHDPNPLYGVMIDDFMLVPVGTNSSAAAFNPPANMCVGQGLSNLMAYITPTNAMTQTGTFSGPGVVLHGGVWSLNTNGITPGPYNYSFVYTNTITGCTYTTNATINMNPVPTLTISGVNSNSLCLMPGVTTTTLIASGSPTNLSYAWAPGSVANSTLVVSPTVTTTYTLSASTGLCGNTKTITVTVLPPVTFNGSLPPVLCTGGQTINLTGGLSSPTPTLGNWTATGLTGTAGIITATDQTGHCWAYAPNALTGPGIYTLTYVSTAFAGCSTTAQYTVEVRNTPTLTTNGPLSRCTNIPGYPALTMSATSTSTLAMTYTWNPGGLSGPSVAVSPTATTFYTVVGSDGYCLSAPNILEVVSNSACCGGTTGVNGAPWHYITSGTLGTATLNGLYAINQNLVITGNVKLHGEFYMAPNVTIKVQYNASVSTDTFLTGPTDTAHTHAHLLSCNAMWNGIVVDTYGAVKLGDGVLIEDAKVAISSSNSQNNFAGTGLYEINLEKVVFNRNKIGVSISNYTYVPAGGYAMPFKINACVFTCRNFTYLPMTYTVQPAWPTYTDLTIATTPTNAMATPYLFYNFTPANLKAPYTTEPSNSGVYVFNSGKTTNPSLSNTTYTTINVGDGNAAYTTLGIFDNLNIGINAINSNVASFGNVFQNTRAIPITTANPYYPGTGINASNNNLYGYNYSNNYVNLTTVQNPTVNINRFYNCEYGVHLKNIFQLNMKYAEFYSTQSKLNPLGNPIYIGLAIEGNRFKNYIANNNKFVNLFYGVLVSTYPGPFNISGSNVTGQLWGTINIRNNYFSAVQSPSITSLGNNFMYYGVYCDNIIYSKTPQPLGTGFYTITPYNGLWIADNTFDRVYRGASVSNFNNGAFGKFVANNTISIVPDHITTNFQFGAAAFNNYNAVYNSNYISGYTISPSTTLSGIYFSMNTTSAAKCNTLYTLPRGIEFAGLNSGTQWRINTMTLTARGMQLSKNGIIGLQGGTNSPADNYWQGSPWSGGFYSTWTDSSSYASNSKVYKRTLTGYDPSNNSGIAFPNSYGVVGNLLNANNGANWPPCVAGVPTKGPGGGKIGIALKIANGTMPYLGSYTSETEEINRFLLYDDLLGDTCLLNSDPTLQSFFNVTQASEIGQLNQAEEALAQGNFNNASSLLSSFSPGSAMQANYKLFYNLCLKYLDSTQVLSSQDSTDIMTLAQKCPFIDGAIIYNARALNQLVNKSMTLYNDNGCDGSAENLMYEPGGGELGRMMRQSTQEKQETYKLFPNPATDKLFVLSMLENEEIKLLVKDVNDKTILESKLHVKNYQAETKLDLVNGIYFVTLITQNNETIIKKLVISK